MNYVHDVFEILGVAPNEKFRLRTKCGNELLDDYQIDNDLKISRFSSREWHIKTCTRIEEILKGEYEIIKNPYKPKYRDTYYLFESGRAISWQWLDSEFDLVHWKSGNCFKTEEKAKIEGEKLIKQIRREYEKY